MAKSRTLMWSWFWEPWKMAFTHETRRSLRNVSSSYSKSSSLWGKKARGLISMNDLVSGLQGSSTSQKTPFYITVCSNRYLNASKLIIVWLKMSPRSIWVSLRAVTGSWTSCRWCLKWPMQMISSCCTKPCTQYFKISTRLINREANRH